MRHPPGPPAPPPEEDPGEPFLPTRTPRTGTPLSLPPPLPLPARPWAAALGRAHAGSQPRAEAPEAELARHLAGLRLELAGFREWLPAVLGAPPRPGPAAVAAPAPPPLPGPGGRRRELALALAGALLALALAFASASAALSWPAYGRLVPRLGGALHSR